MYFIFTSRLFIYFKNGNWFNFNIRIKSSFPYYFMLRNKKMGSGLASRLAGHFLPRVLMELSLPLFQRGTKGDFPLLVTGL